MKIHNTDLISALGCLAIAVTFGLAREPWTPLSAHWPNAILVFMLACSLFLLVRAFVKPERAPLLDEGSRMRMLVSVLVLVLWGLGIQYLGFVTASVAAFYFFWWYVRRAVLEVEGAGSGTSLVAHARSLVVIVGMVGAFHYVFTKYLHVPLPQGVLI